MRKFIFGVAILLLATLLGCNPQVQSPPSANPSTLQPAESAPPSQSNTETSVNTTVVPATPISKIAFVRDCGGNLGWEIFTADSDSKNIADITNNPSKDLWSTWSPDGSKIAFQSSREWHGYPSIYVMEADGNNVKCLTPEVAASEFPVWSPSGNTIAYSTSKGSVSTSLLQTKAVNLFVMDANGGNKSAVAPTVDSTSSQVSPSWFPDSKKLAYASNATGLWEICSVNIDAPDSTRYNVCIDTNCGLRFPPSDKVIQPNSFPALAVSPDGESIAFDYRNQTGERDIYLLSLDTKNAQCLTCGLAGNSYFPTWSPDGSKIAFTFEQDGNTDIYVMNSDGSNPTLLIKNGMFPSWSKGE
jgi:Tol biopolymer transport system component